MAYFNYFIKCIIRRFVKLFFTKKTFVFLLVLAFVFVLSFNSFAYGATEVLVNPSTFNLYCSTSNSVSQYVSPFYVVDVGVSITIPKQFAVFLIQPGFNYRIEYDDVIPFYNCKDMNFIKYVDNYQSSPGVNNGSVPVFWLYYYTIYSGATFNTTVPYYFLFDLSLVNINKLKFYEISDNVSSTDIQDLQNIVGSTAQNTQDTIKDTSQQMQNTITDSSVEVSTDLPTNDTQDITQDGFNNIFMTIKDTFTSSSAKDLVVNIPFTDKSFTINFSNVYAGFNSGIVGTLITLFWWYCVSLFIVKDISNKISKIKGGNLENIENTNIKEDLL